MIPKRLEFILKTYLFLLTCEINLPWNCSSFNIVITTEYFLWKLCSAKISSCIKGICLIWEFDVLSILKSKLLLIKFVVLLIRFVVKRLYDCLACIFNVPRTLVCIFIIRTFVRKGNFIFLILKKFLYWLGAKSWKSYVFIAW